MILPRALYVAAFGGAALLTWAALGPSGWAALARAARSCWTGRLPTWGDGGLLLAPALAGAVGAWGVAWADRTLGHRVRARGGSTSPLPATHAGGAWVIVAVVAVLGIGVWLGDWSVAGRARPGAVLSGWVHWSWRLGVLLCVGLAITGVGQGAARHASLSD